MTNTSYLIVVASKVPDFETFIRGKNLGMPESSVTAASRTQQGREEGQEQMGGWMGRWVSES